MIAKITLIMMLIFSSFAYSSDDFQLPLLKYNYSSGSWQKNKKTQLYVVSQYVENYEELSGNSSGGASGGSGIFDIINKRNVLAKAIEDGKRQSGELVVQIFPEELELEAGVKKFDLAEKADSFKVWLKHENYYFDNNQPIYKEVRNWRVVGGYILVAVNKPELLYNKDIKLESEADKSIFEKAQSDDGKIVVNIGFEELVLTSNEFRDSKERFIGSKKLLLPTTTIAYVEGE